MYFGMEDVDTAAAEGLQRRLSDLSARNNTNGTAAAAAGGGRSRGRLLTPSRATPRDDPYGLGMGDGGEALLEPADDAELFAFFSLPAAAGEVVAVPTSGISASGIATPVAPAKTRDIVLPPAAASAPASSARAALSSSSAADACEFSNYELDWEDTVFSVGSEAPPSAPHTVAPARTTTTATTEEDTVPASQPAPARRATAGPQRREHTDPEAPSHYYDMTYMDVPADDPDTTTASAAASQHMSSADVSWNSLPDAMTAGWGSPAPVFSPARPATPEAPPPPALSAAEERAPAPLVTPKERVRSSFAASTPPPLRASAAVEASAAPLNARESQEAAEAPEALHAREVQPEVKPQAAALSATEEEHPFASAAAQQQPSGEEDGDDAPAEPVPAVRGRSGSAQSAKASSVDGGETSNLYAEIRVLAVIAVAENTRGEDDGEYPPPPDPRTVVPPGMPLLPRPATRAPPDAAAVSTDPDGGAAEAEDGADAAFEADEVLRVVYQTGELAGSSTLLGSLRLHFLSGHNCMVAICNTQRTGALAEDCFTSLLCGVYGHATKMGESFANELSLAAYALAPDGTCRNLLPTEEEQARTAAPASLAANPIMGCAVVNHPRARVQSHQDAAYLARGALHNARALGVDPDSSADHLVWALLTLKQQRKVGESRRVVYLAAMTVVLAGSNYDRLAAVMRERPSHTWPLFRQALGGQSRTVCLTVVDRADEAAHVRPVLLLTRQMRAVQNSAPRSGSVRKFLETTGAAVREGGKNASTIRRMRNDMMELQAHPEAEPPMYPVSHKDKNNVSVGAVPALRVLLLGSGSTEPPAPLSAAESADPSHASRSVKVDASVSSADRPRPASALALQPVALQSEEAQASAPITSLASEVRVPRAASAQDVVLVATAEQPATVAAVESAPVSGARRASLAHEEAVLRAAAHESAREAPAVLGFERAVSVQMGGANSALAAPPTVSTEGMYASPAAPNSFAAASAGAAAPIRIVEEDPEAVRQLQRAMAAPLADQLPSAQASAGHARKAPKPLSQLEQQLRQEEEEAKQPPAPQPMAATAEQKQQQQQARASEEEPQGQRSRRELTVEEKLAEPRIHCALLLQDEAAGTEGEAATAPPPFLRQTEPSRVVLAVPQPDAALPKCRFELDEIHGAAESPLGSIQQFALLQDLYDTFVGEEHNVALFNTDCTRGLRPFAAQPIWCFFESCVNDLVIEHAGDPAASQVTVFASVLRGWQLEKDLTMVGEPAAPATAQVGFSPLFGPVLYRTRGVDLDQPEDVGPVMSTLLEEADAACGAAPDAYVVFTCVRKTTRELPKAMRTTFRAEGREYEHDANFSSFTLISTRNSAEMFKHGVEKNETTYPVGLMRDALAGAARAVSFVHVDVRGADPEETMGALVAQHTLGRQPYRRPRPGTVSDYVANCLQQVQAGKREAEDDSKPPEQRAAASARTARVESLGRQHEVFLSDRACAGFIIYPTPVPANAVLPPPLPAQPTTSVQQQQPADDAPQEQQQQQQPRQQNGREEQEAKQQQQPQQQQQQESEKPEDYTELHELREARQQEPKSPAGKIPAPPPPVASAAAAEGDHYRPPPELTSTEYQKRKTRSSFLQLGAGRRRDSGANGSTRTTRAMTVPVRAATLTQRAAAARQRAAAPPPAALTASRRQAPQQQQRSAPPLPSAPARPPQQQQQQQQQQQPSAANNIGTVSHRPTRSEAGVAAHPIAILARAGGQQQQQQGASSGAKGRGGSAAAGGRAATELYEVGTSEARGQVCVDASRAAEAERFNFDEVVELGGGWALDGKKAGGGGKGARRPVNPTSLADSAVLATAVQTFLACSNAAFVVQHTDAADYCGAVEGLLRFVLGACLHKKPPEVEMFLSAGAVDGARSYDLLSQESQLCDGSRAGLEHLAAPTAVGFSPLAGPFLSSVALRGVSSPDAAQDLVSALLRGERNLLRSLPPHLLVLSLWQKMVVASEKDVCLSSLLLVVGRQGPGTVRDAVSAGAAAPVRSLLRYALSGPCYTVTCSVATDREPRGANKAGGSGGDSSGDSQLKEMLRHHKDRLSGAGGKPLVYNSFRDILHFHKKRLADTQRAAEAEPDDARRKKLQATADRLSEMIRDEKDMLDSGGRPGAVPPYYDAANAV